jgi:hypothetical protein
MELIVISGIFIAIALGGVGLAIGLLVAAIRADQRYLGEVEEQRSSV